ncbi:Hydrogenase expression/formation protein HoxL [Paraburkholderia ribeironis]|uniref:Hydrogenase expression/formation protein HoxL n=1 Tax=Paraburkholderia ribeironis TaxID=1247936 RepID=A0A1N7RT06_9BURK|nr:HypC/HybG/HupF family hydrogenase formation chaperone [Paraburkholderia ribeironis]SIT38237.1 Hydrogenase expression/formation protein HoxL [Paraburkholderia ribeironis]
MCIGVPMQVVRNEPGAAWCVRRGEHRLVSTVLLGDCVKGDWLLVFLDSAREHLDAQRAAEIDAALDLLQKALTDEREAGEAPPFPMPSEMTADELKVLLGR